MESHIDSLEIVNEVARSRGRDRLRSQQQRQELPSTQTQTRPQRGLQYRPQQRHRTEIGRMVSESAEHRRELNRVRQIERRAALTAEQREARLARSRQLYRLRRDTMTSEQHDARRARRRQVYRLRREAAATNSIPSHRTTSTQSRGSFQDSTTPNHRTQEIPSSQTVPVLHSRSLRQRQSSHNAHTGTAVTQSTSHRAQIIRARRTQRRETFTAEQRETHRSRTRGVYPRQTDSTAADALPLQPNTFTEPASSLQQSTVPAPAPDSEGSHRPRIGQTFSLSRIPFPDTFTSIREDAFQPSTSRVSPTSNNQGY